MSENESIQRPDWLQRYQDDYLTLDEVGADLGITREGVRQRLRRLGIVPRSATETRELRWRRAVNLNADEIRESFLRTRSVEESSEAVGLPVHWVKRFIEESVPDYQVLTAVPRSVAKRYSAEDLLESLREASAGAQGVLSAEKYRSFVDSEPVLDDGRSRPGAQAMALRYGSWRGALDAAGLPSNPHSGPDKQFDLDDAIQAVVECWRDSGRAPTVVGYERWQQGRDGSPSSATVRKLTGSWTTLLVWAWQLVHGITLESDEDEAALSVSGAAGFQSTGLVAYRAADEGAQVSLSSEMVSFNYQALERAVRSHARIQNALADTAASLGLTAWSPGAGDPAFDVALSAEKEQLWLFEVKSATMDNLEFQLRIALGQVLRYAHAIRERHDPVFPVIAIELRPDPMWQGLLASLGVGLIVEETLVGDLAALTGAYSASEAY